MTEKKALVVYFSKAGEQYGVGTIREGNTALVAKMIAEATKAKSFEVRLKKDTYPTDYKTLTEVALKEKQASARPEIAENLSDFKEYDVVFLGTPNWWADLPMALYTFIESMSWQGKTVAPFVTHEGSGMSSIPSKIKQATGAEVLEGLALYGHVAQNNREQARQEVSAWLSKLGF